MSLLPTADDILFWVVEMVDINTKRMPKVPCIIATCIIEKRDISLPILSLCQVCRNESLALLKGRCLTFKLIVGFFCILCIFLSPPEKLLS